MNKQQEEAAGWFARMRGAAPDHPDRGRFESWLAADPAHAAAYSAVTRLWGVFDSTAATQALAGAAERRRDLRQGRRRLLKQGLLGLLLAGGAGGLLYRRWQDEALWQLTPETGTGRTQSLSLPDGSTVTEGAASAVSIIFSRAERHVRLAKGEASFAVTRNPDRPFVVEAGPARITVLGTRFAVARFSDLVRVSVDHGRVAVQAGPFWRRQVLLLQDGQVAELQTETAGDAILREIRRPAADGFAFEQERIVFDKASLGEIAETLSRYRSRPVRAKPGAGPAPAITAVVHLSEIDGFLATLPQISPVSVADEDGSTWLSTH